MIKINIYRALQTFPKLKRNYDFLSIPEYICYLESKIPAIMYTLQICNDIFQNCKKSLN